MMDGQQHSIKLMRQEILGETDENAGLIGRALVVMKQNRKQFEMKKYV